MFQRFEGTTITVDLHQIGRSVHIIRCNPENQELYHEQTPFDSEEKAQAHFKSLCGAFEYIGFTPIETDF